MDEELKAILKEAFGDSSSDNDSESTDDRNDFSIDEISNPRIWEPVVGINGLWICKHFLTPHQHTCLLSALEKEGYFAGGVHNQAMRFGDLPSWAVELALCFRESVPVEDCHIPESPNHSASQENFLFPEELLWREPLFNQLIVNIYQPGNTCTC